jgi:phosphoadenosine phosphosulfate reductase
MKPASLPQPIRAEVEKPFSEKLARAKQLVRAFAKRDGAFVSCSFGKDSTVVLWLCLKENPDITVVFNNTGVEFPETLELKERLKAEWRLNLVETKPKKSFWQVAEEHGLDFGRKYRDACCGALKEAPTREVVGKLGLKFNFTGLTALESRVRMWRLCGSGESYYSRKDGVWRIHPIAYWTPEEVWQFIRENSLPVNSAYEKYGLERVGCMFCTSHVGWQKQVSRVNGKAYSLIQERFFRQKLLDAWVAHK